MRIPWTVDIESMMPSSHLILCHLLLLLLTILPSIRVSSNESTLHMRWPKNWTSSYSHSVYFIKEPYQVYSAGVHIGRKWGREKEGNSSFREKGKKLNTYISHSLLQGIFLTQGLNPGILHCRQILYLLSDQGSP